MARKNWQETIRHGQTSIGVGRRDDVTRMCMTIPVQQTMYILSVQHNCNMNFFLWLLYDPNAKYLRLLYVVSSAALLNVLLLRVQAVHDIHALLVHGEDNSSTEHQSGQSGQRTAPEGQNTFLLENHGCAAECVAVHGLGFGALHSRLDGIEGLRHKDGNKSSQTTDTKGADGAQLLARCSVGLGHLLEESV